jgi:hypothetical protein
MVAAWIRARRAFTDRAKGVMEMADKLIGNAFARAKKTKELPCARMAKDVRM